MVCLAHVQCGQFVHKVLLGLPRGKRYHIKECAKKPATTTLTVSPMRDSVHLTLPEDVGGELSSAPVGLTREADHVTNYITTLERRESTACIAMMGS